MTNHCQECFDSLEVYADEDDSESYASYSSSFLDSTDTKDCNGQQPQSVSVVLGFAMASALTLPSGTMEDSPHVLAGNGLSLEEEKGHIDVVRPKLHSASHSTSTKSMKQTNEPIEFQWLLLRCEGDEDLALKVLRSFCEQGQMHVSAMQKAIQEMDNNRILFHSVNIKLHVLFAY